MNGRLIFINIFRHFYELKRQIVNLTIVEESTKIDNHPETMTQKFLYVVDHSFIPRSEYGGIWNVVADSDEECFDDCC